MLPQPGVQGNFLLVVGLFRMGGLMKFLSSAKIAIAATLLASAALPLSDARASTLVDGSFETQGAASSITDFCYGLACAAGAWSFAPLVGGLVGDGLISQSGVAWGQPIAGGDGSYFAFIQIAGTFSQTFTADQTGTLALNWLDAKRSNSGSPNTYTVSVNGNLLGTYTPTSISFVAETSLPFSVIAGNSYTVMFQGTPPDTADRTSFIDNVSLVVSTPVPATLPLFASGLGALGLFGWHSRRKKRG